MYIPREISAIIERFCAASEEVYIVGGAVRDSLMGKTPHDYDMTTPLSPKEILALFEDRTTFREGEKYGTVGVMTDIGPVEITTFRIDGTYRDGRKPEEVAFTTNLREDLKRRDFTVNAMAYSPEAGLIDPFGGREDLEKRRLKTVGDPARRLEEDALRILRAFRFSGQLDMEMEEDLVAAIRAGRERLRLLSSERVAEEMRKILLLDAPSRVLYKMEETGVLDVLFPELTATVGYDQRNPYHDKTLFDHILCVVDHTPKKLPIRYAALFHDVEKPSTLSVDETGKGHFFGHDEKGAETARAILRRLKETGALEREVHTLIKEHMKVHDVMTDKALRRQIRRVGEAYILDLYDLMAADMACTYGARDISLITERKARIERLMHEGVPKRRDLSVDGNDLIALGIAPGPIMGKILKEMEEQLLDDPSNNDRAHWLAYASARYEEERGKTR
ncbi:MAG: CCA tRNA nucleotidyltransferase [Peptoniphilus sp.]|nr:CCA tRNA nucleotidyltransferase [Peptoniphilus sp.]MDY6044438.1 CCA tRNA nucleotidyltransferase [Peptoniphilus sp.]